MIYLDNAATTFPKPEEVYAALDDANRKHAFNVGRGAYTAGSEAFAVMEETRQMLADIVDATASSVYFSSSATEALNQIIYGMDLGKGDCVYVSPFEHNAILRPLNHLVETKEIVIKTIPFDSVSWDVDFKQFAKDMIFNPPKAVFISHVSNVTGYVLPYEEIFKSAKASGAVTVLDCSQSFGIVPVTKEYVDYIVFAGHKSLYASFGIAGFIKLGRDSLFVVKAGGTGSDSLNLNMADSGHSRYEAGSPNIVAIYGLNAALKWRKEHDLYNHTATLTSYLKEKLSELDNVTMYIPENKNTFGIISFSVEGYEADDVGTILNDEFDIAVRTGYHCAAFIHNFIGSNKSGGTVRASLNYFNSNVHVDRLVEALESL